VLNKRKEKKGETEKDTAGVWYKYYNWRVPFLLSYSIALRRKLDTVDKDNFMVELSLVIIVVGVASSSKKIAHGSGWIIPLITTICPYNVIDWFQL
jgi:hypothetical protein